MNGSAPTKDRPGFLDSVRTLAGHLLASLHERVGLLSIELQEEKLRFIRLFVWVSLAIFAGVMAVTFATLAIVYLCWDSARLAVLIGFAVLYAGVTVVLVAGFRRTLAAEPRPLSGTLEELEADYSCIQREN